MNREASKRSAVEFSFYCVRILDIDPLCLILDSDIISDFMRLTSYYIGGGYISYQKKYLSRVKLPNLSKRDINLLLSVSDDKTKINRLVQQLYFD